MTERHQQLWTDSNGYEHTRHCFLEAVGDATENLFDAGYTRTDSESSAHEAARDYLADGTKTCLC